MKKNNIALLITLSSLLSSCSWIYYVPNKQNVTLFKEKNEVELNVAMSAGQQAAAMEASAAVSVTNHFAIQGNFSFWMAIDHFVYESRRPFLLLDPCEFCRTECFFY